MILASLFVVFFCVTEALNNGLARTPPMGWLSWERFRCITDCKTYPDECISERLYMRQADELVRRGLDKVGYRFVNVDDCWAELARDSQGRMVPDRQRFPSGMKALADYMHKRGLLLGIYTDIGTNTCGGYPGSQDHFDIDAQTFASWGIDSVKVDGCYANTDTFPTSYPAFGTSLAKSGRAMIYYCSWPAYIIGHANFTQIAKYCNGWRAFDDIADSASSLYSIINWWGANNALQSAAGPGAWNDADMLLTGDFGLSFYQQQMQLGLWSIIASPLLMSNDLRLLDEASEKLLKNRDVIAVSQDTLGAVGGRIQVSKTPDGVQWWTRRLSGGDLAVMALCTSDDAGTFFYVHASLAELGWTASSAFVRDLFNQKNIGRVSGNLTLTLAPNYSSLVRLSSRIL